MIRRRMAITGLAILACTAFATAACADGGGTPAATTAPPPKPAMEVLSDAIAKTQTQSYKYTSKYGSILSVDGFQGSGGATTTATPGGAASVASPSPTATGTAGPYVASPGTTATATATGTSSATPSVTSTSATSAGAKGNVSLTDVTTQVTLKAQVLLVDDVVYAKLDPGLAAGIPGLATAVGKWLTLDKKRIGATSILATVVPGREATSPEVYLKGVASAETVSPTEIKGTLDLGKSAPTVIPAGELGKAPADAKKVPFTAILDDQGRLMKIVVSVPKLGPFAAADLTTTYADYGSTEAISKPAAADTVAAPDLIYGFIK